MTSFEIAPFAEEHLEGVVALWNRVFADAYYSAEVDRQSLRSMTLGCSQFDEGGSFVALVGEEAIGAVLSFGAREFENDLYWHMVVAGWIGAVFVTPDWRRRGVASRLLLEAESYHEERGRLLVFAGGGEGIATPFRGVEEGWTEARALFGVQRYHRVRRTCAVDIDLARYQRPETAMRKERALAGEGVEVRPGEPDDADAYRAYLEGLGEVDWQKTLARWSAQPGRTILARVGGRVVGDCRGIHVTADGRAGYGNIVTQPDFRNRGIGTLMLARAVERARQLGARSMPLWTRPKTAERFYLKLGFRVVRNFDTFGKVLEQDLLSGEWIARQRYL